MAGLPFQSTFPSISTPSPFSCNVLLRELLQGRKIGAATYIEKEKEVVPCLFVIWSKVVKSENNRLSVYIRFLLRNVPPVWTKFYWNAPFLEKWLEFNWGHIVICSREECLPWLKPVLERERERDSMDAVRLIMRKQDTRRRQMKLLVKLKENALFTLILGFVLVVNFHLGCLSKWITAAPYFLSLTLSNVGEHSHWFGIMQHHTPPPFSLCD